MNAIGFGNINSKRELKNILKQVRTSFTQHDLISQDEEGAARPDASFTGAVCDGGSLLYWRVLHMGL